MQIEVGDLIKLEPQPHARFGKRKTTERDRTFLITRNWKVEEEAQVAFDPDEHRPYDDCLRICKEYRDSDEFSGAWVGADITSGELWWLHWERENPRGGVVITNRLQEGNMLDIDADGWRIITHSKATETVRKQCK